MEELLKRLFTESSFEVSEIDLESEYMPQGFFCIKETLNASFYFLIVFTRKLEIFLEDATIRSLIENVADQDSYDARKSPKNLYLLIVSEVATEKQLRLEGFRQTLYRIEEDPYVFKKHILTYSTFQLEHLSATLENKTGKLSSQLNSLLIDEKAFRAFFKRDEPEGYYGLVSQLFTKLPFLKPIPKTSSAPNLNHMIETAIIKEDLGSTYARFESEILTFLEEEVFPAKEFELRFASWMEEE